MSALLLILLSAVLVNVMALTRMPSWRPFEAVTGTFRGAQGLAIASLIADSGGRRDYLVALDTGCWSRISSAICERLYS